MAAPVTPQDFLDNIPSPGDSMCDRMKKAFIEGPEDFYTLMNWMFNADGTFSANFLADLCDALNDAGCGGGGGGGGTTTSTTTDATGCQLISVTVGGTGDPNLDRTVQWGTPVLDGNGHCRWQGITFHYDFIYLAYNTGATQWEVGYLDSGVFYTVFTSAPAAYASPVGQVFTLTPAPGNPWGANPATFSVAAV
jgi:hypothetical protein